MDETNPWQIFFKVFGITSIGFGMGFGILNSMLLGSTFQENLNLYILTGLLFGVAFGGIIAYLYQPKSILLDVRDRGSLISRVTSVLRKDNIMPINQSDQYIVYKYQGFSIVPLTLYGEFSDDKFTISGPKYFIDKMIDELYSVDI